MSCFLMICIPCATNASFAGANTVNVGYYPKTSAGHVGTKIAFTRVPEKEEFAE